MTGRRRKPRPPGAIEVRCDGTTEHPHAELLLWRLSLVRLGDEVHVRWKTRAAQPEPARDRRPAASDPLRNRIAIEEAERFGADLAGVLASPERRVDGGSATASPVTGFRDAEGWQTFRLTCSAPRCSQNVEIGERRLAGYALALARQQGAGTGVPIRLNLRAAARYLGRVRQGAGTAADRKLNGLG